MKLAPLLRASALVTAVALLPTATAGLAAVDARSGPEFGRLIAIYQQVKANYVESVDDEKLIRGAIDGMLASLDPHSSYLDGRQLENLVTQIDGNYEGLGLSVTMEDSAVKVIAPMRGSPAEAVGVKAGDYITHLDGKLIYGGTLDDAVEQMRGPAGSSIRLTLFRAGRDEPFDVTVTRAVIDLEPVTHKIEGKVGVISINQFSRDVGADVAGAYRAISKQLGGAPEGLVLDLRQNPGGSLDEAVMLSDLFLDKGEIVSQRGRRAADNDSWPATPGDIARTVPMIVLIDAGSASASEIVAGALQDQGRAVVMGERSFGKGSVQTLLMLSKNSALKLTTARYFTPKGRSVQEGGIEPDIMVPQLSDPDAKARAARIYRESDLRGHLINEAGIDDRALEQDKADDPRFKLTAEEVKAQGIEDFQLHYAVQTLRRTAPGALAARRR